jgi:nitrite reductase/ring-hydroxylating ferredoxin subunit
VTEGPKWISTPDGAPPERQPKWRRDFPIDSADDSHVARRDFSWFLLLTSGAFVAGQLWIAAQNALRKARGRPPVLEVARVGDVRPGSAISFQYPDEHSPCLLVRLDEERFVAYDQRCSHLACAVIPRPDQGRLVCPCHKGFFEIETGVPLAGPPRRPLPRIALEVRGGVVYATGVELRV